MCKYCFLYKKKRVKKHEEKKYICEISVFDIVVDVGVINVTSVSVCLSG